MPYRYFIKLSYNGSKYHGWQLQENSKTIQEMVNKALSLILNETISTLGAGRTDTGVHAKEFYAHFDTEKIICEKEDIIFRLNGFLSEDIVIHDIIPVKNDSHARFNAISRTYKYYISRSRDPFNKEFSYYIYGDLDIELMNRGAEILLEYTDFSCFSKSHTQTKTNNCKIIFAKWKEENGQMIFTITADRFLRNMVRAIVGTLIELGQNKITIEDLRKIIEGKNRSDAGLSVPANALFLTEIKYPNDILKI